MSGEQAEERTAREGRERAEAQLLDELGLSFHRVGNSLQVTLFDPFKIESLVPADKSYTAHFAMDKVWKKLIQMRVATNTAAENSLAPPETTNSPTKPNEPACAECSRLASRVEELDRALFLAKTRLGICADRMRGCNEANGGGFFDQEHELIDEVDAWEAEAESVLAGAHAEEKE